MFKALKCLNKKRKQAKKHQVLCEDIFFSSVLCVPGIEKESGMEINYAHSKTYTYRQ